MSSMLNIKNLLQKILNTTPIGTIAPYAGATAPKDWLICDGSYVSQSGYPKLFDVIEHAYAGPNEATLEAAGEFALPDLRGKTLIGAGKGNVWRPGATAWESGAIDFQMYYDYGSVYMQAHTHAHTNPTVKTPTLTADDSHKGEYVGANSTVSVWKRDLGGVGSAGGDYAYMRMAQSGAAITRSTPSISAGKTCTVSGGGVGAVSGASTSSYGNIQPSAVINYIIYAGITTPQSS